MQISTKFYTVIYCIKKTNIFLQFHTFSKSVLEFQFRFNIIHDTFRCPCAAIVAVIQISVKCVPANITFEADTVVVVNGATLDHGQDFLVVG